MLNVAPQKERIPDHLRAMAEQDDKSAASGKTGEQSSIGVGCAPGEERDSAISICAVHSATVTAAIAEYCEDTVEKQKTRRGWATWTQGVGREIIRVQGENQAAKTLRAAEHNAFVTAKEDHDQVISALQTAIGALRGVEQATSDRPDRAIYYAA